MKSVFSRAGREALAKLPLERTLFAFDFDGTIAPIVSDPRKAFTLKNLRRPLRELAKRARVAVISGRALKDLESRLHFPNDFLVGNHGLEGLPEFKARGEKAKKVCRKWSAQLRRMVADLPRGHGIYIEDKGHSLSLHYRDAKSPAKTVRWLNSEFDNLWPLPRVIGGKMVFNLVPKGSPHKGTALKALMKRFQCTDAVFVGDDITDEDAFAIKGKVLSVRVGRKQDSLAKFFVPGQDDMLKLLNEFLRRLS